MTWKELANGAALVGLFVFLYGLILVMLDLPYFEVLKTPAPKCIPTPDKKGKIRMAINIAINLTLATLLSRKLFEKTGNVWLGTLINTTMATFLTIATSRMIPFLS